MIKYEDGTWKLYTPDGSQLLSTHETQEAAEAQAQALHSHKRHTTAKRYKLVKDIPPHFQRRKSI